MEYPSEYKRPKTKRLLKAIILSGLLCTFLGLGWLVYIYWFKTGNQDLALYKPPVCQELLDRNDKLLDYICPMHGVRIWRPLKEIDPELRKLVVMMEDAKFFSHDGFDFDQIIDAIETDLEKRKMARGASTITQQLAKNLFLSKEKSLVRKASEVPLAIRIEKELTKNQILELYLNTIEWGPGIYGVETAARLYFDKESTDLSSAEAWLLTLMIPNPKELNLWIAPKARKSLLNRAKKLSERLADERHKTREEAAEDFKNFENFIDQWSKLRPRTIISNRKFPARWEYQLPFSIANLAVIRKSSSNLMSKIKRTALKTNLDREIQEKIETAVQSFFHYPQSKQEESYIHLITLTDGESIRAIVPIPSADVREPLENSLAPILQSTGLEMKVENNRNLPNNAIWR